MKLCPKCGQEHDDTVDFCDCGEILAWEPSAPEPTAAEAVGADGQTATIAAPARITQQNEVSVVLFRADRSDDHIGNIVLPVEAGGRATLVARVRNQSQIVDSFTLTVDGLPDGWWTIDPPTTYLLPMKARQGYEADVVIALHPPRSSSATAGLWDFKVIATSEKHPPRMASATAGIDIAPFSSIFAAARPPQISGRRGARLQTGVENAGNRVEPVLVEGHDGADRCRVTPPVAPTEVKPGTVGELPVVVRPKRTHWIGNPIDHRIDLTASSSNEPEKKVACTAVYRQRAWIPWWLPFLILLLAVIAIILYLLWPHHVKVPDVRRQPSSFAAQKRLEKAGLALNPKVRTALRPKIPSGTVIAQAPAPGKTVDKGRQVTVVVAAGHHLVRVPKLAGLKVTEADQRLRTAKLTLGAVQPKLEPDAKVGSQLPHAGARRREGTPVSVVLAKKKVKAAKKKKPSGAVPDVPLGSAPAAAMKAIKAAGLKPVEELEISTGKRGTVTRTVPAAKVKPADGIVHLKVSAGFPKITYDAPMGVLDIGGADGTPRIGVSRSATVASRGAWSADGKQIAYVYKGKRLYVVKPGPGAHPKSIFVAGRVPVAPAFAPLLKSRVLVFGTVPASSGATKPALAETGGAAPVVAEKAAAPKPEVCWMDLDAKFPAPSCKIVNATSIEGFAWSPRGTVLLVSVKKRESVGLLRLSTRSPFATDQGQWAGGDGRLYTKTTGSHGVLTASFSRDGTRLAVVSNLGTKKFVVSNLATDKLGAFAGSHSQLAGCDVDWRPDDKEWLVVQASANCTGDAGGRIVRVLLDGSSAPTVVVAGKHRRQKGRHPAYQPINLSPGPERAPVPGTRP